MKRMQSNAIVNSAQSLQIEFNLVVIGCVFVCLFVVDKWLCVSVVRQLVSRETGLAVRGSLGADESIAASCHA